MTTKTEPKRPTVHIKPCTSEAITGHGYDAATRTLGIQWKNGHAPELLADVPPELAQRLDEAKSKGRFIHDHIRGKFKRIEG